MTGQVPDAGPYIERMDVLVNASDPEPFGIVLLEGMARGVAVLAVDSGGPAEFIEQRAHRACSPRSGEPQALADALEPLLASPERRNALAAAGRESFLRDFTDAAMRSAHVRSPLPPSSQRRPRRSRLERAGAQRARGCALSDRMQPGAGRARDDRRARRRLGAAAWSASSPSSRSGCAGSGIGSR